MLNGWLIDGLNGSSFFQLSYAVRVFANSWPASSSDLRRYFFAESFGPTSSWSHASLKKTATVHERVPFFDAVQPLMREGGVLKGSEPGTNAAATALGPLAEPNHKLSQRLDRHRLRSCIASFSFVLRGRNDSQQP